LDEERAGCFAREKVELGGRGGRSIGAPARAPGGVQSRAPPDHAAALGGDARRRGRVGRGTAHGIGYRDHAADPCAPRGPASETRGGAKAALVKRYSLWRWRPNRE